MVVSIRDYAVRFSKFRSSDGDASVVSRVFNKYFTGWKAPLFVTLAGTLLAFSLYRAWVNITSWLDGIGKPLAAPSPARARPAPPLETVQEFVNRYRSRMQTISEQIIPKLKLDAPQDFHQLLPEREEALILFAAITRLRFDAYAHALKSNDTLPEFPLREIRSLEVLLGPADSTQQEQEEAAKLLSEYQHDPDPQVPLDPAFHDYHVLPEASALGTLPVLTGQLQWSVISKNEQFKDPAANTLRILGERQPHQKTRIVNGVRKNEFGAVKKKVGWGNRYPERTKRTAAVDRLQAIGYARYLLKAALSSDVQQLTLNGFTKLQGYFQGIVASDLAPLKDSYGQDPVFLQAMRQVHHPKLVDQAIQVIIQSSYWKFFRTASMQSRSDWEVQIKGLLDEIFTSTKTWVERIEELKKVFSAGPYFAFFIKEFDQILPVLIRIQQEMAPGKDIEHRIKFLGSDIMLELSHSLKEIMKTISLTKVDEIRKALMNHFKVDDSQVPAFIQSVQYLPRIEMWLKGMSKQIGWDRPVLKKAINDAYKQTLRATTIPLQQLYVNNVSKDGLIERYFPNGFPKGFKLPENE